MSQHEVLALDSNFSNWKRDRASGFTAVEPFLYYSVEHITKMYNLTDVVAEGTDLLAALKSKLPKPAKKAASSETHQKSKKIKDVLSDAVLKW